MTAQHLKFVGEPLSLNCRVPKKATPGEVSHTVQFYCTHGRDHEEQSDRIEPKEPEADEPSSPNVISDVLHSET